MTATAEKAIGIAHRLYEARRVLRWLLGDRYADQIAIPRRLIRQLAPEQGGEIGALHFLLVDMRREQFANAGAAALLLAAAAEEIEPDELTPAEVRA